MSNSAFFSEVGNIGAELSNELAPELGVTFQYIHLGNSPVNIVGFIKNTVINKELILATLAGREMIEIYAAQHPSVSPTFPANGADVLPVNDMIVWTPVITGVPITLTIDTVKNAGSNGTMYVLSCSYHGVIQAGSVGFTG